MFLHKNGVRSKPYYDYLKLMGAGTVCREGVSPLHPG
jgi:hypothetical protein